MSLNDRYLAALSAHPLLTKSGTTGVFACLNEILATCFSGEYHTKQITIFGKQRTVRHVLSPKIVLMIVYGAFIATPISHFYYNALNRVFRGKLSPKMKLAQLAASLSTLTPLLSAIYVSWLALINTYQASSKDFATEMRRVLAVVKGGLKNNFWLVYRTSAVTSLVALTAAQNFVPQELWVVFFNLIYFVVGTVQNTKIKIKQRDARLKKLE